MIKNLIKYVLLILLSQILLFILPVIFINLFKITFINITLIILNSLVTWYCIKKVERLYYHKYNKASSLLYNACPLIGVALVFLIIYKISNNSGILYLAYYYVSLFSIIFFINFVYISINIIKNNK